MAIAGTINDVYGRTCDGAYVRVMEANVCRRNIPDSEAGMREVLRLEYRAVAFVNDQPANTISGGCNYSGGNVLAEAYADIKARKVTDPKDC